MVKEAQRSSENINKVTPEKQIFLDDINKVIIKHGFTLNPTIQLKKCGFIPNFFIRKYQKYLIASFIIRKVQKLPKVKKGI